VAIRYLATLKLAVNVGCGIVRFPCTIAVLCDSTAFSSVLVFTPKKVYGNAPFAGIHTHQNNKCTCKMPTEIQKTARYAAAVRFGLKFADIRCIAQYRSGFFCSGVLSWEGILSDTQKCMPT